MIKENGQNKQFLYKNEAFTTTRNKGQNDQRIISMYRHCGVQAATSDHWVHVMEAKHTYGRDPEGYGYFNILSSSHPPSGKYFSDTVLKSSPRNVFPNNWPVAAYARLEDDGNTAVLIVEVSGPGKADWNGNNYPCNYQSP